MKFSAVTLVLAGALGFVLGTAHNQRSPRVVLAQPAQAPPDAVGLARNDLETGRREHAPQRLTRDEKEMARYAQRRLVQVGIADRSGVVEIVIIGIGLYASGMNTLKRSVSVITLKLW